MAALDWSQCPAVESIPGKMSGAWVLRGTRMPVSAIFENIEAGASIDDVMEWFDGLNREQVKAAIEFAARSLDRALRSLRRCRYFSTRERRSQSDHFSKATPFVPCSNRAGINSRTANYSLWRSTLSLTVLLTTLPEAGKELATDEHR
jgi:uncharacterized protein (DUF433 family)